MLGSLKNKISGFFHTNWILLIFLSGLLFPVQLQAKTLVLVHGFLSGDGYWRTSGFTKPLELAGWKDAGSYNFDQMGMLTPRNIKLKEDIFITVNLPSEANLQTQETILQQYLQHLYLIRKEPVTLVGHSAGGVVARLSIINKKHIPVNGLVTIAAPHLGTPTANAAYLAGNSPLGMMASMMGERVLQDGRGLFFDLKEERPSNFLYWMNHQPHPNIHYASIIRKNGAVSTPGKYDYVVPAQSQNMNNVWALRNRSGVAFSKDSHSLSGKDGLIVVEILKHIK